MNRVSVDTTISIQKAVGIMRRNGFSQLPVTMDNRIVRSIDEGTILDHLFEEDSNPVDIIVEEIMQESFPRIGEEAPLSLVTGLL